MVETVKTKDLTEILWESVQKVKLSTLFNKILEGWKMGKMQEIITSSNLFSLPQNKTNYIPIDIHDISKIGDFKKRGAKKAICWLLSKAPHSGEEIADHFVISRELVKGLLTELTKANLVVNVSMHSSKYYLKSQNDSKKKDTSL